MYCDKCYRMIGFYPRTEDSPEEWEPYEEFMGYILCEECCDEILDLIGG